MVVSKEFTFHAAHLDTSAPEGDQCGRLHGHTYRVDLSISTLKTNSRGMVIHGDELKKFYREVIEPRVEHQFLNETLSFNPTMEAVCKWIAEELKAWVIGYNLINGKFTTYVQLWETPTMSAGITL